jgi:hypothetical protein
VRKRNTSGYIMHTTELIFSQQCAARGGLGWEHYGIYVYQNCSVTGNTRGTPCGTSQFVVYVATIVRMQTTDRLLGEATGSIDHGSSHCLGDDSRP